MTDTIEESFKKIDATVRFTDLIAKIPNSTKVFIRETAEDARSIINAAIKSSNARKVASDSSANNYKFAEYVEPPPDPVVIANEQARRVAKLMEDYMQGQSDSGCPITPGRADYLEQKIANLTLSNADLIKERDELLIKLREKTEHYNELKAQYELLNDAFEKSKEIIAEYQLEIDQLKRDIQNRDVEIATLKTANVKLTAELKLAEEEKSKLVTSINEKERRIGELNLNIKQLENDKSQLETELAGLKLDLTNAKKQYEIDLEEAVTKERKAIEKKYEELIADHKLAYDTEIAKLLADHKVAIATLEADLATSKALGNDLSKAAQDYERSIKDLNTKHKNAIEQLTKQYQEDLNNDTKTLKELIAQLEKTIMEKNGELALTRDLVTSKDKELALTRDLVTSKDKELAIISDKDSNKLSTLFESIRTLEELVKEKDLLLTKHTRTIDDYKQQIKSTQDELRNAKKLINTRDITIKKIGDELIEKDRQVYELQNDNGKLKTDLSEMQKKLDAHITSPSVQTNIAEITALQQQLEETKSKIREYAGTITRISELYGIDKENAIAEHATLPDKISDTLKSNEDMTSEIRRLSNELNKITDELRKIDDIFGIEDSENRIDKLNYYVRFSKLTENVADKINNFNEFISKIDKSSSVSDIEQLKSNLDFISSELAEILAEPTFKKLVERSNESMKTVNGIIINYKKRIDRYIDLLADVINAVSTGKTIVELSSQVQGIITDLPTMLQEFMQIITKKSEEIEKLHYTELEREKDKVINANKFIRNIAGIINEQLTSMDSDSSASIDLQNEYGKISTELFKIKAHSDNWVGMLSNLGKDEDSSISSDELAAEIQNKFIEMQQTIDDLNRQLGEKLRSTDLNRKDADAPSGKLGGNWKHKYLGGDKSNRYPAGYTNISYTGGSEDKTSLVEIASTGLIGGIFWWGLTGLVIFLAVLVIFVLVREIYIQQFKPKSEYQYRYNSIEYY